MTPSLARQWLMPLAVRAWLACTAIATSFPGVNAEEFPSRPITFIIGLAAGGFTDTSARSYADVITQREGWKIVIDNRAGAGGGIAAAAVQNAAPDGYTLLVFSGSQHATVAAISPNMYQPVAGFAPITLLFDSITLLAVPASSPARSVAQLFEIGRTKPGGLTFATQGVGSPAHLFAAQLADAGKVPIEFVHYRGGSALLADFVAGRVDFALPTLTTVAQFIADGRIRVLAVNSAKRVDKFPDVPTFAELGYAKQSVASWFAVATTAGTPAVTIERLRQAFLTAANDATLKRKFADLETPVITSTPDELGRLMTEESAKMQVLVPALGLKQ
jgi:tripartite-type tricarboxylate transporter receptor subunit TctC